MRDRYLPVDEMFDLFKDFDGLFRRTFGGLKELPGMAPDFKHLLPKAQRWEEFYFPVECYTTDKQVIFRAELPGVDPTMTEVLVVGDQLVIRGEKREDKKFEGKDLFFQEIARGRFERRFALPAGFKKDQIKASFDNGILEVMVPADFLEASKKVPIELPEIGKKVRAA